MRGESVGANFTVAEDWRYRHGPGGQREQKRQYLAPGGDSAGGAYRWTYYLLAGDRQMAVYRGTQTVNPGCDAQRAVWFEPLEYLTYGVGETHRITTSPTQGKRYAVSDHLGSVRLVLDNTGGVLSQTDYKPFGGTLFASGTAIRKGYIDKETDAESAQGDYGARKYDAELGRFLSVDARWEASPDLTPYGYGASNPLSLIDPEGEQERKPGKGPTQADGLGEGVGPYGTGFNPRAFRRGMHQARAQRVAAARVASVREAQQVRSTRSQGTRQNGNGTVQESARSDATSSARTAYNRPSVVKGRWVRTREYMSKAAARYQQFITGKAANMSYLVNGVKFDGKGNRILLEAKSGMKNFVNKKSGQFHKWFTGKNKMLNQAKRQVEAANGTQIQWHFEHKNVADAARQMFQKENIQIRVIHTPLTK